MNTNMIFLDLETTGLHAATDQILEIGILPVDVNLEPLDVGWSSLVYSSIRYTSWVEAVQEMHVESGLWQDLQTAGYDAPDVSQVAREAIAYCEKFAERNELPLSGSSIEFDRKFLEISMPKLNNWFHYRNANASSMKEFFRRWFPDMPEHPKSKNHRALQDCYDSVSQAKWYKDRLVYKGEN